MDVFIQFNDQVAAEDSMHLEELSDILEGDYGIAAEKTHAQPVKGEKLVLTTGIAIAGLAVSTLSMLISALSYWRSQRPQYSVSVKCDDRTIVIDNIKPAQINAVVAELKTDCTFLDVDIAKT